MEFRQGCELCLQPLFLPAALVKRTERALRIPRMPSILGRKCRGRAWKHVVLRISRSNVVFSLQSATPADDKKP